MYYSPNSPATVDLPPRTLAQGWQKNPILYFTKTRHPTYLSHSGGHFFLVGCLSYQKGLSLMVAYWDDWHTYLFRKLRGAIQCLKT